MKYFIDGDRLVITKDDFVSLQESPAVFCPLDGRTAKAVLEHNSVAGMPLGDLMQIRNELRQQEIGRFYLERQ